MRVMIGRSSACKIELWKPLSSLDGNRLDGFFGRRWLPVAEPVPHGVSGPDDRCGCADAQDACGCCDRGERDGMVPACGVLCGEDAKDGEIGGHA